MNYSIEDRIGYLPESLMVEIRNLMVEAGISGGGRRSQDRGLVRKGEDRSRMLKSQTEVHLEKMEANQEETEAVVKHYKWPPSIRDMHLAAHLRLWASNVLHGAPKGATYKEIIRALDDRFGNQYLATGYGNQLRTNNQNGGEFPQEFAAIIEQLTHHALPVLHNMFVGEQAGHSSTA